MRRQPGTDLPGAARDLMARVDQQAVRIGKVEYIWNGRDENSEADELVTFALDGHQIHDL